MISLYDGFKSFQPVRTVRARSVEEISEAVFDSVKRGIRIRPMGLGYSWSEHSFTNGLSLSVAGLRRHCKVDVANKTVTVDAGIRMGDVTKALALHGLCLPSLAFLPEMTAGGAVATATHGTNHLSGTMSDFVCSVDIVLASGEVKTFSPQTVSEAEMKAARVSVGMLGVISRVVFQAIDMPWVKYTQLNLSLDEFMRDRELIFAKYRHIWVHWSLGSNTVRIDCLEQFDDAAEGRHRYVRHRNAVWHHHERSVLTRLARPFWYAFQDIVRPNVSVTKPQAKNDVRTSMQYTVSRRDWAKIVSAIAESSFASENAGQIMEMKFVRGNGLSYLGPNADQDAVCFNVYWMVARSEQSRILRPFEDLMKSFGARPHWGKDHQTPDVDYMKLAFPRWNEFDAVRRQFDKNDIFLSIR